MHLFYPFRSSLSQGCLPYWLLQSGGCGFRPAKWLVGLALLFLLPLGGRGQSFSVDTTAPAPAAINIGRNAGIRIAFSDTLLSSSLDSTTLVVRGEQTGLIEGTRSLPARDSVVFTPSRAYRPGEVIRVTLTDTLLSIDSTALTDYSFRFQAASDTLPFDDFAYPFNEVSDTSARARAVHAADLDGDGDLDIVGASRDDDRVVWFENDGNQNFSSRIISSSADGAVAVYVEDVDSDGDLDVLSASRNDNTIAWYENNGSQQFTTRTIDSSAGDAYFVYAVDFDADGDVDVLATAESDDDVIWYENNGNQSFTKRVIDNFLDGANRVFPADIDGDGDLDVVASGFLADEVVWYRNDGQLSFTKIRVTNQADIARVVYADDVDQDGDIDLLHAAQGDDEIAWWENDGSQSFTKRSLTTSADGARYARTVDVDGDGDLDIVGVSFNDDKLAWWENDGAQNFTEHVISRGRLDGPNTSFIGDLDDDGVLDILTASFSDDRISWFKIQPRFAVDTVYPAPATNNIARDSVLSFVFSDSVLTDSLDSSRIRVRGEQTGIYAGTFTGGGTDSIVFTPDSSFKPGEVIRVTITTKLYSDNQVALDTAYSFEFRTASSTYNLKATRFKEHLLDADADNSESLHAADLDNDGDIDILAAIGSDSTVAWYENDGHGGFAKRIILDTAESANSVRAADVDNDGDLDLVVGIRLTDAVVWLENDGQQNFTYNSIGLTQTKTRIAKPFDIDADGDMDVLTCGNQGGEVAWFENDGKQNFSKNVVENSDPSERPWDNYAADMDSDGDVDLMVAYRGANRVKYFENDGKENFSRRTLTTNVLDAMGIYAVDLDGNGDMDFVSASRLDDKVAWYDDVNSTQRIISDTADGGRHVYACDLDGDGDQDVLSANTTGNAFSWFRNDGSQVFSETTFGNRATGAAVIYAADFDDDGDLDVLTSARLADRLSWYEYVGPSLIVNSTSPDIAQNAVARDANISLRFSDTLRASSVDSTAIRVRGEQTGLYTGRFQVLGDSVVFDPDRLFKPDEIIRVTVQEGLQSLANSRLDTAYSFEFRVRSAPVDTIDAVFFEHPIADTLDNIVGTHAADLDRDGDLDLLSASTADSTFAWFENGGHGDFSGHLVSDTADGANSIRAADVDNDGDLDLVAAIRNQNEVGWYQNDGNQNFTFQSIDTTLAFARQVFPIDVDRDGDLDVVACAYGSGAGAVAWYENDGAQTFTKNTISNNTSNLTWSIYATDVESDGDIDILAAHRNTNLFELYTNDGGENFSRSTVASNVLGIMSVSAANLDNDADMDLLSGARNEDEVSWYDDGGTPGFTQNVIDNAADGARFVYTTDLNGDGNLDVLSANAEEDEIAWYPGDNTQSFSKGPVDSTADGASAVYAGDVDGDGRTDIIGASRLDDKLSWYEWAPPLRITALRPQPARNGVPRDAALRFRFSDTVRASSVDSTAIRVRGEQTGLYTGRFQVLGDSVVFTPDSAFRPGEVVRVTLLAGGIDGVTTTPLDTAFTFEFRVAPEAFLFQKLGFVAKVISDTADFARQVRAADLDRDGDLDVLSASQNDDRIAWYENDGNQNFTEHTISDSARGAVSVFTVDVDSDGDLDVLSASEAGNTVSWYQNDGNQNFSGRIISTSALDASSVFAIDLDGDGDVDVLSAVDSANTIAWYENDGSQNFSARTISTQVEGAFSVHAADMENDGDVDVLAAARDSNQILLFENDGAQRFRRRQITSNDSSIRRVYATDINGDGFLDILSASFTIDEIAWLKNDGSNNFLQRTIDNSARGAVWVHAADVDGDNNMDVLAAAQQDDRILWYQNDGLQDFTKHIVSTQVRGPSSVYPADVDGDGQLDLLSTSQDDDKLAWYKLLPSFELRSVSPAPASVHIARDTVLSFTFNDSVLAGSLDSTAVVVRGEQSGIYSGALSGGGTDSVVFVPDTSFRAGELIRVTIGAGLRNLDSLRLSNSYSFEFRAASIRLGFALDSVITHTVSDTAEDAEDVFPADLDGDGDIDLLSVSNRDNKTAWYQNDGRQNFTERIITTASVGASSVSAADLDSDGDLDVLNTAFSDDEVAWYENDGRQNFTENIITDSADGAISVYPIDLDGDGDMDAVSAASPANSITWYENDGRQNFTEQLVTNTANRSFSVYATDVDGDGDVDLLSASEVDNTIAWYRNDGDESFTKEIVTSSATSPRSVYALDLDGDGDVDVLSASTFGDNINWYENDGSQNFTTRLVSGNASGAQSVFAGDVDGDGDVDVLSTSFFKDEILLHQNDGSQGFTDIVVADDADGAQKVYTADVDSDGDLDILSASLEDDRIAWYQLVPGPDITVSNNGRAITPGDTTPTPLDGTDLGTAFLQGDTVFVRFRILNNLEDTVVLNGSPIVNLGVGNAFSVVELPEDTLPRDASTSFVLAFAPRDTGRPVDTVRIASNGPSLNDFTFAVAGEAENCPELAPNASLLSPSCFDSSDGEIRLNPAQGVPPYRHRWSTGARGPEIAGLSAGVYTDTITDAAGCVDTLTFTLAEPAPLSVQAQLTPVTCPGGSDGQIAARFSGGTPGYDPRWSIGATTASLSGLDTGRYLLEVTDTNGCHLDTFFAIGQNDTVAPTARANDTSVFLDANGVGVLSISALDSNSSDNCTLDSLVLSRDSFFCADLGPRQVVLSVFDQDGLSDAATATVQVRDTLVPLIRTQPATLYLDDSGSVRLSPGVLDDGTRDNCALAGRSVDPKRFGCADQGLQTVRFTAEDISGNRTTTNVQVEVRDTTKPIARALDVVLRLDSAAKLVLTPAQVDNGSSDNCGIDTAFVSPSRFDCGDLGNNSVTLTVVDAAGNRASTVFTATIEAIDLPQPAFEVVKSCVNEAIVLRDASTVGASSLLTSIAFDFDDNGGFDTTGVVPGDTVRTSYADTGRQQVSIRATARNGCVATARQSVRVNPIPRPGFTAIEGCEGEATIFTDTSRIARGSIASVAFDFQDDGTFDRTGLGGGATVSFQYPTPGAKNVGLRAVSDRGCEASIVEVFGVNKTVLVNPNPEPTFSASTVCAYDSVPFADQSSISSGSIDSLVYDLDDDGVFETEVSSGQSFRGKFDRGGRFSIGVFAKSDAGCIKVTLDTIEVRAVPQPGFVLTQNCVADTTVIVDTSRISIGTLDSIAVDFDDDGRFEQKKRSPGDTLKTLFTDFRPRFISLRAVSKQGCVAEARRMIDFTPQPVAAFTAETACFGQPTRFRNQSAPKAGPIAEYRWRFGDGGQSQRLNPENLYSNTGSYTARLEVRAADGCRDTARQSLLVFPTPRADFSVADTCAGAPVRVQNRSRARGAGSLRYRWRLGDGREVQGATIAPRYDSAGRFQVALIVVSPQGCADSTQRRLSVRGLPEAQFAVEDACLGTPTSLTNASVDGAQFEWSLGNGAISTDVAPQPVYRDTGAYLVRLVAHSVFGCRDTTRDTARVLPNPVADFQTQDVCRGDSTPFTDQSRRAISYRWNFGDGTPVDTSASPLYFYGASGTFSVQLIVRSAQGCRDTATQRTEVFPAPNADFAASAQRCLSDTLFFDNLSQAADRFAWDFGDGTTSEAQDTAYRYARPGSYTVTLRALTAQGCVDSIQDSVTILPPPKADFQASPVCLGDTTRLINRSRGAERFAWMLGNGAQRTSSAPRLVYQRADTFALRLLATSAAGCRDTAAGLAVVYPLPEAGFTATDACNGRAVRFTDTSQGANTRLWRFGEGGSISGLPDPSYTYGAPGRYTASLRVTSLRGCVDSTARSVAVYPNPVPDFSVMDVCLGETTAFSDQSRIASGSYDRRWDFGDGTGSATAASPGYRYADTGTYAAKLVLTSGQGCSDSSTQLAQVFAPPQAEFSVASTCAGDTAVFGNTSTGASSFLWQFGDGRSTTQRTPIPVFDRAGEYTVLLKARNVQGCRDTATDTLQVRPRPQADFRTEAVCEGDSLRPMPLGRDFTSYAWDFGEGGDDERTEAAPAYTYASAGRFTIRLAVANAFGCRDTVRRSQQVNPRPLAGFTVPAVCQGELSRFEAIASPETVGYQWKLGNGFQSIQANPQLRYPRADTFPVSLVVRSGAGCRDTASDVAVVHPLPQVAFLVEDACRNESVQAVNQSPRVSSFQWRLGDGRVRSGDSLRFRYAVAGTYTLSLRATSSQGCVDSLSKQVQALPTPNPSFATETVCEGQPTPFQLLSPNGVRRLRWRFGDGTGDTSARAEAQHRYPTAGDYDAQLVVENKAGCRDTSEVSVSVARQPEAAFSTESACVGDSVRFANASSGPAPLRYRWRFGNGQQAENRAPATRYLRSGRYKVALSVSTEQGCADQVDSTIDIHPIPAVDFTVAPVCPDDSSRFEARASVAGGSIVAYRWRFGTRGSGRGKQVALRFGASGSYPVALTVESAEGCRDSARGQAEVLAQPSASFAVDSVCFGEPTRFRYTGGASASADYRWRFGDELGGARGRSPEYTYVNPGRYTAQLQVEASNGCRSLDSATAVVHPRPIADFRLRPACAGDTLPLTQTSVGEIARYRWRWGRDGQSSSPVLALVLDSAAQPDIALRVISPEGCADSVVRQARVLPIPQLIVSADTTIGAGTSVRLRARGANTYRWTPAASLTDATVAAPLARPESTTRYRLVGSGANGCFSTAEVEVAIEEDFRLSPVNAFTPNGDGRNDAFHIENIEQYPRCRVRVYDRYGREVFETTGYRNHWRGTFEGRALPADTYYYTVDCPGGGRDYKGTVTILR